MAERALAAAGDQDVIGRQRARRGAMAKNSGRTGQPVKTALLPKRSATEG